MKPVSYTHLDVYKRQILSYAPNGFIRGLEKAKAIPVIIPISNPEFAKEFISRVDGLLLAGGQDVSPLLYGEEPHLNLARTYPARDAFEIELIKEAYRQHKPIFAVCRGLQIDVYKRQLVFCTSQFL